VADRPLTFSDLIHRVAKPQRPDESGCQPLIGRGAELDDMARIEPPAWWVILHRVSSRGAFLIHAHPISAPKVVVEIDAPDGVVLSVVFKVNDSRAFGELYETAVGFVEDDAGLTKWEGLASKKE
jgi:hypothetical protein